MREAVWILHSFEHPQAERPLEEPQVRLRKVRPEIPAQGQPPATRRQQTPRHPADMFRLQQTLPDRN